MVKINLRVRDDRSLFVLADEPGSKHWPAAVREDEVNGLVEADVGTAVACLQFPLEPHHLKI